MFYKLLNFADLAKIKIDIYLKLQVIKRRIQISL